MAKSKKKPAVRKPAAKTVRTAKEPKFISYFASATHAFAVANVKGVTRLFVWNALEGRYTPNWDVDGKIADAIATEKATAAAKQLQAEQNAAQDNAVSAATPMKKRAGTSVADALS